jgi:hypothetical protein
MQKALQRTAPHIKRTSNLEGPLGIVVTPLYSFFVIWEAPSCSDSWLVLASYKGLTVAVGSVDLI